MGRVATLPLRPAIQKGVPVVLEHALLHHFYDPFPVVEHYETVLTR